MDEQRPLLATGHHDQTQPNHREHTSSSPVSDNVALLTDNDSEARSRPGVFSSKLLASMLCFSTAGVITTAIGALIESIEHDYHLSDSKVATVFPAGVAGYCCATAVLQTFVTHYGWRGVAFVSPVIWLASMLVLAFAPPFPLVLLGYFATGFGTGLCDAGFNAWASRLPSTNIVQGFLHGSFSVGCVAGPYLVSTLLRHRYRWFGFYRIMIAISLLNIVALTTAFRHENAVAYKSSLATVIQEHDVTHVSPSSNRPSWEAPSTTITTSRPASSHPLWNKATWSCGIFYFFYMGVESSYTDWIVTYMQRVQHISLSTASLSSSSFWAGMAVGRLVLGGITQRFGLVRSVTLYIVFSICLQILFARVSYHNTYNDIDDSDSRSSSNNLAISLLLLAMNGFSLGPMFPSGIILLASKVPANICVGAVAAATAMGQVGGAIAPLTVGVLSDKFGMSHLLDVVLLISFVLLGMWLVFARVS